MQETSSGKQNTVILLFTVFNVYILFYCHFIVICHLVLLDFCCLHHHKWEIPWHHAKIDLNEQPEVLLGIKNDAIK